MALSREMRLLAKKWEQQGHWPKRLESLEITNIRGWAGQRVDFAFPIVAISGENGSGKSTILQAAAASYADPDIALNSYFASDFFFDSPWDTISDSTIRFGYRQGNNSQYGSVRKPTNRWRGNPERPRRKVYYVDLSRLQPVSSRIGYLKLAKPGVTEQSATQFLGETVNRLSSIMGKQYTGGRMAVSSADTARSIPVISVDNQDYSGFHQGAGEYTLTELLHVQPARTSLMLIDEVDTSLHPRAQRRLVRDLAELCRLNDIQIIMTTHSPYILAELPPSARGYIMRNGVGREIVFGVSPEFAMTQMDEEAHPECDVYVEDDAAKLLLNEILVRHSTAISNRVQILPYGAANVGQSLGQMAHGNRFPRPTVVYLDGDQPPSRGCSILPGGDAPERVVFTALQANQWQDLADVLPRDFATISAACNRAMTSEDHHDWLRNVSNELKLSVDGLWQSMCSVWADRHFDAVAARDLILPIETALI